MPNVTKSAIIKFCEHIILWFVLFLIALVIFVMLYYLYYLLSVEKIFSAGVSLWCFPFLRLPVGRLLPHGICQPAYTILLFPPALAGIRR